MKPTFLPRKKMKMVGARRSVLDRARGRIVLMQIVFVCFYAFMAIRVFDLGFIQGTLQAGEALYERYTGEETAPVLPRADIVDRNGVLLATSLQTPSLYADPKFVLEPEETARSLAGIFPDLSYGEILQDLQRPGRFSWVKRNLTPEEQFAVLSLGNPGLGFRNEMRRIWPQGALAAHFVGHASVDGRGLSGIEKSFDSLLEKGREPLRLTLDVRLQHILRREALQAMNDFGAKGAAGMILDLSNGEVLAGVSLPDFDPHYITKSDIPAMFNRLTYGVYELGSTFKIFSTAAMLEFAGAHMGTVFDAKKPLKRSGFNISDYHAEKRMLTLPEVFIHSSNIGAALMGEAVGTEQLKSFYQDLGLLDKPSLEIGEMGRPFYQEPWRDITTLTASYGHGIAVSPFQLVTAAASIVGGGVIIKPTLIRDDIALESAQGYDRAATGDIRVVSPQTAHRMRQLLRLVVTEGTGKNAEVAGFRVGGKTGTAEQPSAQGGYDRSHVISSFLGFFPMEAPRYAVFVMVDEPHGTKKSFGYATGGWVAAPAVGRVVEGMAAVLGLEPVTDAHYVDMSSPLRGYIHDKEQEAHLASY